MIQFNEQFVRDYFKPFLLGVLTDMAAPAEERKRGGYLLALLNGEQLKPEKKDQFILEYFSSSSKAAGSKSYKIFMGKDETQYRRYFIDELENVLKSQYRLAGSKEKTAQNFLPSENNTYGTNSTYTRNVNRLAHQMIMNFEKRILKGMVDKKGTLSDEEKAQINEKKAQIDQGKIRLVEVNGVMTAMTEEQLQKEKNKQIIPFMEPGLSETIYLGVPPNKNPDDPTKIAYSQSDIIADFAAVQAASIEQLLNKSGLEIVDPIRIIGDKAEGTVIDAEGQELTVEIDLTKANTDADKFKFIFKKGDLPQNENLVGKVIKSDYKDLKGKFLGEKGRKSAKKVFEVQDKKDRLEMGKGRKHITKPGKYRPAEVGKPEGPEAAGVGGLKFVKKESEGIPPELLLAGFKAPTKKVHAEINLKAPTPTPPLVIFKKSPRPQKAPIQRMVPPMEAKAARNKRKTLMPQQPPINEDQERRQKREKAKKYAATQKQAGYRKWAAAGAIGTGVAGLLGGAAGSMGGAELASLTNNATIAIKMTLYCIGIDCIS